MSTEEVIRRPHKVIASKSKRWSAPSREKGFSPALSTPDQITRDVRGLKLRQRVSIVLGDEILREELEEVVGNVDFNNRTTNLQSVRTYQDFLVPTSGLAGGGVGGFTVTPVSDIRGMDTIKFSKEERLLRCKVASVYRLAQDFGWSCSDDQVFCTARALEDDYYYLTPPYGVFNGEITAASLIKLDMEGNTVEPGTTNFGHNKLGNQPHCILYEALKDVNCVIYLTTMQVKAVSAMECGLLPISNYAVAVGEVNYFTLSGIDFSEEDKEDISRKCEAIDKVLFIRNMGAICIGKSVEETLHTAYLLNNACQSQIQAVRAGIENLIHIDKEIRKKIYQNVHEGDDANQNKCKQSDVLFEAWMRRLDSKGHKTGYTYSVEVFKKEPEPTPKIPKARTPAAKSSSFNYPQDRDRNPVRRAHTTGRGCNRTKLRWLNEPVKSTEYRKEPSLESPTIEDVIVKDRKPEIKDKDIINEEAIDVKEDVVAESAPPVFAEETPDTTVTTTVVTITEPVKEPKENLDQSASGVDDSKLLSPEGQSDKGSAKKRKKVKKSRSFKDTLKEKLGITKKEPIEKDERD